MTDEPDETASKRERILDCLDRLERGFQRKWENNADFRDSLKGKDRDIVIDLTDLDAWTLTVRDGKLQEIQEGRHEDPDVKLTTEAEDFLAIFSGDLSPLKAYMTKRVKVSAGLRDILLVKSFMGG